MRLRKGATSGVVIGSGAKPDVAVRVRPRVVAVQRRRASIGRVVPVATADREAD